MQESVQIYYGEGRGKTAASIGFAIKCAGEGKRAVIIQFLKGKSVDDECGILQRLEPEIRVFRFEKAEECFADLSEEQQEEEKINIRNALNYAKKVLSTGECELVVLDEVLGLIDEGVATCEEIIQILSCRNDSTGVILTGWRLPEKLRTIADAIYKVDKEKA